ncbi:hypothetical protein A6046_08285 [[Haemophilus] ducreyi]|uniref:Uncharacterized protein n=3 Tax=Haemophilus ducreyi TaxID=730 RepID=Q7VM12_HAEDU|nr:DUF5358 family protein [[Haemophilus] ducreyi]AAP96056.1 hypothetical protein HD_1211 [[Haemophilus] ducreyi 35000HP]AKO31040.1 hypothetical protein RY60_04810 [[Haemophilus] ducreyi]AKO32484.1 hypothetical protein RZ57_04840 [[Haemophilus] ducreyi]AKO33935.1 hypothetical protein RZ58_04855 [[Haemophilus] ducreyi]AKO35382.1 hypothetical protein RZ59_04795 [[Haemophilus] ducreyi]
MFKVFSTIFINIISISTFAQMSPANSSEMTNQSPNIITSEPKYKISATDTKILIRQLNNIEQCLFPELAGPNHQNIYNEWPVLENITMDYFQSNILKELIGAENLETIEQDAASQAYFENLYEQYNHQIANVDKARCENFKPIYQEIKQRISTSIPQIYK